jgi:N,N'-diacetylchitobiose transport system permease protein
VDVENGNILRDLEEAAMVDGSTRLGVFVKILLPLIGPGLVATSVFAFITTWNEYIFARVLLNDQSKQTVTVWLSYFLGSSRHTDWGALMAASTLTAIPVVVFFLLVQRRIAFGLTQGAVRGCAVWSGSRRSASSRAFPGPTCPTGCVASSRRVEEA